MDEFLRLLFTGVISAALAIWGISKFVLERYAEGFLREKGKNLATKQDIGEITKLVEDIKHENNILLEEIKSKFLLRSAIIEKRIEAYQLLYSSIVKVFDYIIKEKVLNYIMEYFNHEELMEFNSNVYNQFLYLSPKARNQLLSLVSILSQYKTKTNKEEKEQMFMEISKTCLLTLQLLADDVELPSIGREDYAAFEKLSESLISRPGEGQISANQARTDSTL